MSGYFERATMETNMKEDSTSIEALKEYFKAENSKLIDMDKSKKSEKESNSETFVSNGLYFKKIGKDEVEVVGLASAITAQHVVIPGTTSEGHFRVTSLGNYCFNNANIMKTISIPGSVTEIGKYAFAGSSIQSIELSPSITRLGEGAFYDCASLVQVDMNHASLEMIAKNTFQNCIHLKLILLGESITTVEKAAFQNCYELTDLIFGDQLKSVAPLAFDNCKSLKTVSLGSTVDTILSDVFKCCKSLEFVLAASEYTADNAYRLFKDSPILHKKKGGCEMVLNTLVHMDADVYTVPADTEVIAPFALVDNDRENIYLPKSVRLLLPNAFCTKAKKKVLADGQVMTMEGHVIRRHIHYAGKVTEWMLVEKLADEDYYYSPVLVTCKGESGTEITFVDYI